MTVLSPHAAQCVCYCRFGSFNDPRLEADYTEEKTRELLARHSAMYTYFVTPYLLAVLGVQVPQYLILIPYIYTLYLYPISIPYIYTLYIYPICLRVSHSGCTQLADQVYVATNHLSCCGFAGNCSLVDACKLP